MSLQSETIEYLYKEVLRTTQCLILALNNAGEVEGMECPWGNWSIDTIRIGSLLPEPLQAVLDASLHAQQSTFFPYIYLDDSQVVDVHLCTGGLHRKVILRDVSEVHQAELKFQQKAHEVSLLLEKQSELNQELELQRVELERASQAKSRFIASMSHEFRSPITSIMGHADVMSRQMSDVKLPAAIQRASWHLLTLVENLLEQARQGEGVVQLSPGPVHLASVLEDMQDLFSVQAVAKNLGLGIADAPAEVCLEADELRLRQVLINLLSNALRYTREGRVDLEVQVVDNALIFRVIDTGPGISEPDQERIFQPFMRLDETHQAGAGLGLTITRQLIDAMGGKLGIESEPGHGSTFSFSLPLDRSARSDISADQLAGCSVLLVDDDVDILSIHEIFLKDWGMQVHSASTLSGAFALLKLHTFDLVFTDLHLEDGGGEELLQFIRAQRHACRTILCSGSGVSEDWKERFGGITDEFLLKPVRPDRLKAAINRTLSGAAQKTPGLSSEGKAAEARLRRKYIDSLPAKRVLINDHWEQLQASGWSANALAALQAEVHRLTGSAGSYGFENLGAIASTLETFLRSGDGTSDWHQLISQQVSDLLTALESQFNNL